MKTKLLILLGAAACFTGGYFAGKSGADSSDSGGKSGRILHSPAAKSITGGSGSGAAAGDAAVREFQPGRPFAPGDAKAWLLSLAAILKENAGGDFPIELIDLGQIFITMDEASITEVSAALVDLMAMLKADDPLLKSINDGDDILDGAFMVSAFRLSQLNPGAALELLKSRPEGVPDEIARILFARIAAKDPVKAEALLAGLDEKTREGAVSGMIQGMAGKDPGGAIALAEKYPDSIGPFDANRLIERMMQQDPAKGMAAAVRLTAKKNAEVLVNAYRQWHEQDQNAALAWAQSYRGPGEITMRGELLKDRAATDPAGASREFFTLQKEATPQDSLTGLAYTIADELADNDVAGAAQWAESLAAGDARRRAMQHSMNRWLTEDPTAASEWLNKQPQGQDRDQLAVQLINNIQRRDPAAAFEWARNIQDQGNRTAALRDVFESWREQDPDAARAARDRLPEDLRKPLD